MWLVSTNRIALFQQRVFDTNSCSLLVGASIYSIQGVSIPGKLPFFTSFLVTCNVSVAFRTRKMRLGDMTTTTTNTAMPMPWQILANRMSWRAICLLIQIALIIVVRRTLDSPNSAFREGHLRVNLRIIKVAIRLVQWQNCNLLHREHQAPRIE